MNNIPKEYVKQYKVQTMQAMLYRVMIDTFRN
jgi:hypothetical protein